MCECLVNSLRFQGYSIAAYVAFGSPSLQAQLGLCRPHLPCQQRGVLFCTVIPFCEFGCGLGQAVFEYVATFVDFGGTRRGPILSVLLGFHHSKHPISVRFFPSVGTH